MKAVLCGSCGVFIKTEEEGGSSLKKPKQKSWGGEREEGEREYRASETETPQERRTEGRRDGRVYKDTELHKNRPSLLRLWKRVEEQRKT